jgi:dTDP-4-dehydrorhamnose reductase
VLTETEEVRRGLYSFGVSPPVPPPGGTRNVAVIGATGQLGRALVDQFAARPGWTVRGLTHQDIEISEPQSITAALSPAPSFLINTAYWADEQPVPALRVNALGPRLLAEFCASAGTTLVQMSTDYVFDGETEQPYRETDCPYPRSVYGATKLAGEHFVQATTARSLIVRVSSLYGAGGSRAKRGTSFVSDMLDMQAAGKTIRVVTDQVHSPTYAPDAAAAIAELLERDVTGIVHLSNRGQCTKFEFAQRIFELTRRTADLVPIRVADLPATRHWSRFTALAHERLAAAGVAEPRTWEDGLREHLRREGVLA